MLIWENLTQGIYSHYSNWHVWIKKEDKEYWSGVIGNDITGEFFTVAGTSESSIKNYCSDKVKYCSNPILVSKEVLLAL